MKYIFWFLSGGARSFIIHRTFRVSGKRSAVKLDLYGLKFFYTNILKKTWRDIPLIKPPKTTRIPDIVTIEQADQLFAATGKLSYKVFFFTIYSLGLRLGEDIKLKEMHGVKSLLLTLAHSPGHHVHTFPEVLIRQHLLFHSFDYTAYGAIFFHLELGSYLVLAATLSTTITFYPERVKSRLDPIWIALPVK